MSDAPSILTELSALSPEVILGLATVLALGAFALGLGRGVVMGTLLSAVLWSLIGGWLRSGALPEGGLALPGLGQQLDPLSGLLLALADLAGLLSVFWLTVSRVDQARLRAILLVAALAGCHLMLTAESPLTIILALETVTLATVGAAALSGGPEALSAAFRMIVLGAVATVALLLALPLLELYGARAPVSGGALPLIPLNLSPSQGGAAGANAALGQAVIVALVVGVVLFKLGAVPLHGWVVPLYQVSPPSVTFFILVAPKLAAIGLLARLGILGLPPEGLGMVVLGLSALSMVVGNVMGLVQRSYMSLIAASSIAHSGFLMAAALSVPGWIIVLYGAALLLGNLAALVLMQSLLTPGETDLSLDAIARRGRGEAARAITGVMVMLTLAGLPPTIGFVAKFRLILGLFIPGDETDVVAWAWGGLALLVIVNSALSLAYYIKIPHALIIRTPSRATEAGDYIAARATGRRETLYRVTLIGLSLALFGTFSAGGWVERQLTGGRALPALPMIPPPDRADIAPTEVAPDSLAPPEADTLAFRPIPTNQLGAILASQAR